MNKEIATRFGAHMTWLPLVALIIFAVCFAVFVYWTLKKENKKVYEEAGTLPLMDGATHE